MRTFGREPLDRASLPNADHLLYMPCSLPRWTGEVLLGSWLPRSRDGIFPHRSWPSRNKRPVGIHDCVFEACSSFTRVTACRFACPPKSGLFHKASIRPVARLHRLLATQAYRDLLGWDLHPLVFGAGKGARLFYHFCHVAYGADGNVALVDGGGEHAVGLEDADLTVGAVVGAFEAGGVAGVEFHLLEGFFVGEGVGVVFPEVFLEFADAAEVPAGVERLCDILLHLSNFLKTMTPVRPSFGFAELRFVF